MCIIRSTYLNFERVSFTNCSFKPILTSQRFFSPFFFFSRKKVMLQMSLLKKEAESARKIAAEDIEKTKQYSLTAIGKDMIDVLDTLQKGVEAFEVHQKVHAPCCNLFTDEGLSASANSVDNGSSDFSYLEHEKTSEKSQKEQDQHLKSLSSIYTGVKLSMKMLEKNLAKHGIKKIPVSKGDLFDPNIHEAVGSVPASEESPHDTIVEVLKDGFKINDRVLRAAQVSVALKHHD